jgi:hypothetical protein
MNLTERDLQMRIKYADEMRILGRGCGLFIIAVVVLALLLTIAVL